MPKVAPDIVKLMKEVMRHIRELEEQFFYEEDSDAEERLYGAPKPPEGADEDSDDKKEAVDPKEFTLPAEAHDKRLAQIRDRSNLQQFWCIPLNHQIGLKSYDFLMKLSQAQRRHSGGRLFDVITCDPPW